MNGVIATAQFLAWDGGCLLMGRHDIPIPEHSHQAIQLVLGHGGRVALQTSAADPWISYSAALIPSRQPHSLDARDSEFGVVMLIEPETREGRAMAEQYLRGGIVEVETEALRAAATHLFAVWRAMESDASVIDAARAVVRVLARDVEPSIVTDERILSAIDYINAHLTEEIRLEAVAEHACLSPSRFRHLFVEQTGMGLRPYVLWRRFLRVWNLLMSGESLSTAAHAAGFADAAHLARTSKRTFGFPPSLMKVTNLPPTRTAVTQP